jgi:NADH:ubiquinone oxidoreductase subunit 3 (subunit A)
MSQAYLGIAVLFAVGILNAAVMLGLSNILSVRRPTLAKLVAYVSGVDPLDHTRHRYFISFCSVAIGNARAGLTR